MPAAGDGSFAQLGDGQFSELYNSSVPVQAAGGRSFTTGCTGGIHSCALEPSGQAWCWGGGYEGQLGDSKRTNSLAPVAVAGNHTFRSVTCGASHTCALDGEGRAWCWGGYLAPRLLQEPCLSCECITSHAFRAARVSPTHAPSRTLQVTIYTESSAQAIRAFPARPHWQQQGARSRPCRQAVNKPAVWRPAATHFAGVGGVRACVGFCIVTELVGF